jgi:UDP-N-acetylglucosamine--N-acetylmuramyl-(pentapeptide) pyrophosphoryl-undecaprenol N-acetylglucosamine transferase
MIQTQTPAIDLHFVGSPEGLEHELIAASRMHFAAYDRVQAGPMHGVGLLTAAKSAIKLLIGTAQALRLMLAKRPGAAFLTGGWVGVPVAVAAWLLRVPVVIFVPDIEPGLTLKVIGRFARVITATTDDTAAFFPGKRLVATGYPLRGDLMAATRAEAVARFGLDPQKRTLLVFGGSRGARSINRAVMAAAAGWIQDLGLQIIHVSGSLDWAELQAHHASLAPALQADYHIYEYLHDLGLAMAAAELVISRAGASTLGEFPYFELPAILIPYPHAWRYQRVNAEWLSGRGAAHLLKDEDLGHLAGLVADLWGDAARLGEMARAAGALKNGQGAANIAKVILAQMEQMPA